ncbi:MAG TPA: NadS family protein [Steroidobacteraceae bacterium]|nr:NadS family protein [Steroidobacteraceae bacterium]
MKNADFESLLGSVREAGSIIAGKKKASRVFKIEPSNVKALRDRTTLSQAEFAALLGVELATLRNWEQGRRQPTGPAKALLRAIEKDPKNVLRALAAGR